MAGTIRKRSWTTRKGETKTAWTANYRDGEGRWRLQTFATKREADAFLTRTKSEVRDGTHTPDRDSITVAEAADLWLKRGEVNGLERGTLRTYMQYVQGAIVPELGTVKLTRLTRQRVEDFREALLRRFAYRRAQLILSALRMILSHAQGRGLIAQNNAVGVRINHQPRDHLQLAVGRTIPTREEAARLFTGAEHWLRVSDEIKRLEAPKSDYHRHH